MTNNKNVSMLETATIIIKEFEGCYLSAYPDPLTGAKPITIGYGSTVKLDGTAWCMGNKITELEADSLLQNQLSHSYVSTLAKTIPNWDSLNYNQQAALVSFGYNLGAHFYGASNFNTITRVLHDSNYASVPKALLLYINPGSNVEEGLRRRRAAEGQLFMKPVS